MWDWVDAKVGQTLCRREAHSDLKYVPFAWRDWANAWNPQYRRCHSRDSTPIPAECKGRGSIAWTKLLRTLRSSFLRQTNVIWLNSLVSGAHSGSYTMGTGGKRPTRELGHSTPSSVEVRNKWSYTSTPPIRIHSVDKDSFIFKWNLSLSESSWCGAYVTWPERHRHVSR